MVKKPDIKTRKKLRITMCVLYLMELVICTMPFIQDTKVNADGLVTVASPFNMFMMLFGVTSNVDGSFAAFSVVCVVLILIPIINFLFCALDKERNLKNIVSVISCFVSVFLILLFIPRQNISIGDIVAILVYVLIMFITSIAMVMRLSKDVEDKK